MRISDCGFTSLIAAVLLLLASTANADEEPEAPATDGDGRQSAIRNPQSEINKQLYTGRVVLLPEALEKRGIKSYEEMKDQVVLETFDGRLFPIVADWRGRAFYQDERLRNRKVELVCNERPGVPYLQVLAVFTFDEKDRRQATDYWCDICAIPMYEIKPCDCCQGENRLRFRPQNLPDYLKGRARIPVGRSTRSDEPSDDDEAAD